MIQYEYLRTHRRSEEMPDDAAAASIGNRILNGFTAKQFYTSDRDGLLVSLVTFVGPGDDTVWCVYVD